MTEALLAHEDLRKLPNVINHYDFKRTMFSACVSFKRFKSDFKTEESVDIHSGTLMWYKFDDHVTLRFSDGSGLGFYPMLFLCMHQPHPRAKWEIVKIENDMVVVPKQLRPILEGLTVCATGSFDQWGRTQLQDLIRELGGKPTNSVSRNTDLLIVGRSAGSKLNKARTEGVRTIYEQDFTQLLQEGR